MRFSFRRLGMIWGKIGYQRGKIEYTLSPYQQNPYAGVGGDVSYRYYTRLFKTIAIYWVPNIAWGVALYNWANWEYERSIRKKPGDFDDEKPPQEEDPLMSGYFQLSNSTKDFKSRTNGVFDQLGSLEKEHIVQQKLCPSRLDDDFIPTSSVRLNDTTDNPNIPSDAVCSTSLHNKQKASDLNSPGYLREPEKWQKYTLTDVNDHMLTGVANRHALSQFFQTRVKKSKTRDDDDATEMNDEETRVIFRRPPTKKKFTDKMLENDDDEPLQPSIKIHAKDQQQSAVNDNEVEEEEVLPQKLVNIKKRNKNQRGSVTFSSNTNKKMQKHDIIDEDSSDSRNEDDESTVDNDLDEP
ncbi:unnamed protein product [Didymodactylos carnosus]|uniref:Cytochrome b-c1 complex subunit 8 n=1 Tax=Didymodactylos carnosus TaxID=1234261 RepID=A0A814Y929_9BILA|nr:unnamed protein product [Didymodactylos carnosus]CAF3989001.1 unnamed protein product [Didymodactylos carnosus]